MDMRNLYTVGGLMKPRAQKQILNSPGIFLYLLTENESQGKQCIRVWK